ncbi:hypothetical protein [Burkholderia catarinensis]|nr:hypothetical protein [Burkholderia catarinensis]
MKKQIGFAEAEMAGKKRVIEMSAASIRYPESSTTVLPQIERAVH